MYFSRHLKMFIVLALCTVGLCWAGEKIETRIGPLNIEDSSMTETRLISQFGEGYVRLDKYGNKVLDKKHIYYVSDEKVWIEISFSHVLDENLQRYIDAILVTKTKLCDKKFRSKEPFGPLATSKGIKIGDSIDKVISAYGKPAISIDIIKDRLFSSLVEDLKLQKGHILRYDTNQPDELYFVEFYFNGKGLHSLLISESE